MSERTEQLVPDQPERPVGEISLDRVEVPANDGLITVIRMDSRAAEVALFDGVEELPRLTDGDMTALAASVTGSNGYLDMDEAEALALVDEVNGLADRLDEMSEAPAA